MPWPALACERRQHAVLLLMTESADVGALPSATTHVRFFVEAGVEASVVSGEGPDGGYSENGGMRQNSPKAVMELREEERRAIAGAREIGDFGKLPRRIDSGEPRKSRDPGWLL